MSINIISDYRDNPILRQSFHLLAAETYGLDSYVIAEIDQDTVIIYDLFSKVPVDIMEICGAFGTSITKAEFAYHPLIKTSLDQYNYMEEDTTFFTRGDTLRKDMDRILCFPELIHA